MKVLALDPSSTCVGYAVLNGLEPNELAEAGRFTPDRLGVLAQVRPGLPEGYLRQDDLKGAVRVMSLFPQLYREIETQNPSVIVIEVPSGKAGTGSKAGASSSLAVYGMGVGMALAMCLSWPFCPTVPVSERQWTRATDLRKFGGGKAGVRAKMSLIYHRFYDFSDDVGGDMSDAVAIGRWWIENHGQVKNRKASKLC